MRSLSIGECLVELSALPWAGHWQRGIAGDTLNTAWYARMQLPSTVGWQPFWARTGSLMKCSASSKGTGWKARPSGGIPSGCPAST